MSLTRNTGDAEDVRVAHQETIQDVSRLVGVDHNRFGGGLGASADPHQGGQLVLLPMLLLLVLRATEDTAVKLLYSQAGLAAVVKRHEKFKSGCTLSSWSSFSMLL